MIDQVSTLVDKALTYTPYDVRWVPGQAKICAVGATPVGKGVLSVYNFEGKTLTLRDETERSGPLRCCTFVRSASGATTLASGNFDGKLQLWDLEHLDLPITTYKAHDTIVNTVASYSNTSDLAPEIATGSRDGSVKLWDTRVQEKCVLAINSGSKPGKVSTDVWSIAFGRGASGHDLTVGYDNGMIRSFDLRNNKTSWVADVQHGVCSLDYEPRDPHRLVASNLNGLVVLSRTMGDTPAVHYTKIEPKVVETLWSVRHHPNHPTSFVTTTGSGTLQLYHHSLSTEPPRLVWEASTSKHPITSFDWNTSPSVDGLCCYSAFDMRLRIGWVHHLA